LAEGAAVDQIVLENLACPQRGEVELLNYVV
jgi:hypothetical protein